MAAARSSSGFENVSMARFPWHNEYPISAADVAAALDSDIPALAGGRVEPLGEGWDFATFLVDGQWVLRFPKRRSSERALSKELRVLDALHRSLTGPAIAIPRYQWVVKKPHTFALTYAGYRYLEGNSLVDVAPEPATVERVSTGLGQFLKDLHTQSPTPAPRRFSDQFAGHVPEFREQFERLEGVVPRALADTIQKLLESPPPRFTGAPAFCHADLLIEHIFVSPAGVAIIDWGDARWEDPWSDFVGLWAWAGDRGVQIALEAYRTRPADDDWIRIRYKGICVCIGQVFYGHFDARPDLVAASLTALERMWHAGQIDDPGRGESTIR